MPRERLVQKWTLTPTMRRTQWLWSSRQGASGANVGWKVDQLA
ncbi:MAG: hypothetical protein SXV54_24440 [Chloroflexota bacterium]|nr:hypothetical protein [Chloroflexota bacterium]